VTTDDVELDSEVPGEVTRPELLDKGIDIEDEFVVDKETEGVGVQEEIELLVGVAEFTEVVVTVELLFMELDREAVGIGLGMLDEDAEVVEVVARQALKV
jgi:hypothetical protein